jgi:hypothetical protein
MQGAIFIGTATWPTLQRIIAGAALAVMLTGGAAAEPQVGVETVCVKYGPCPLALSTFACTDTPRSSFIRRVCYDAPKAFMVIKLNDTWYPYCEIDAATVQQLITAESAGKFYNQAIRSRPDGSHGPFDCRDHPMPNYVHAD